MSKKIIIDINHPGEVHFFKHLYRELKKRGHKVKVVASSKPLTYQLLKENNIPFLAIGSYGSSIFSKVINLIWLDLKMLFICLFYRPDLLMGHVAFRSAHIGWLLRIPNYCFDDTEHAIAQLKILTPFAYRIYTPMNYARDFGSKHIRYEGYHELAYLHPNRFKPDPSIKKLLGIKPNQKYVIIRFVAWNAVHDKGMDKGFTITNKIKAVKEFEKYGRVFITSEIDLPIEIADRAIAIPASRIHDAMAYSSLVFGESSTMSSEAACLGVPAIYIDDSGRCYTDEQEIKYGLVKTYKIIDQVEAIKKGIEVLRSSQNYEQNRSKLIREKIDVTEYLLQQTLTI